MIKVTTSMYPLGQGHRFIHDGELGIVDVNIVSIDPSAGLATEATQLLVLAELQAINLTTASSYTLLELANWDKIVGNGLVYTYYTGVAAGNPSGSTSNLETLEFQTGGITQFTQTYTYNAANDILTVTTT